MLIVRPGDEQYDQLSRTFTHTGSPALIVRPGDAQEVAAAVTQAAKEDLVLSVRSGGHSGAGYGTNDGGMVVDLSRIDGVEVLDGDVVRIGAGATWGQVAAALAGHGLVISSGDTSSVGVGGLMVGGGIGWLVRKYGLAIDHLVGAEIVTADGSVLRADESEHPDLFWAIRGGGGAVGVVTTFEVRARREPDVLFGTVAYPLAEAAQVLRGWRDIMRSAPDELTTTAHLLPSFEEGAPPMVMITICYAGEDDRAIEPLLGLGTVLNEEVARVPYADTLGTPMEFPPGWLPMVRNRFAPSLDDELIDAVVDSAGLLPMTVMELRALGGAMARVPAEATAFAHRDSAIMLTTAVLGTPEDHQPRLGDFEAMWARFERHTAGAYGNFLSTVRPEDLEAVYPAGVRERLAGIKRAHDPANLFNRNVGAGLDAWT